MYLLTQNIWEKNIINFFEDHHSVQQFFWASFSFGPINTHAKFFELGLVRNLALSSVHLGVGIPTHDISKCWIHTKTQQKMHIS